MRPWDYFNFWFPHRGEGTISHVPGMMSIEACTHPHPALLFVCLFFCLVVCLFVFCLARQETAFGSARSPRACLASSTSIILSKLLYTHSYQKPQKTSGGTPERCMMYTAPHVTVNIRMVNEVRVPCTCSRRCAFEETQAHTKTQRNLATRPWRPRLQREMACSGTSLTS